MSESQTRNFWQSLVALFLSSVTSIFAGFFLGISEELLLLLPGLFVLIPGALNMRGSIFASLGSRLGSSLHLGSIETFSIRQKIIKRNIFASLTLSLSLSSVLGVLAWVLSTVLGIMHISLVHFVFISVVSGVLAGLFLLVFTFMVTFKSFRYGWDPDNVTSPLINTLGDLVTIPTLLAVAHVSLFLPHLELFVVFIILVVFFDFYHMLVSKSSYRSIVLASFFVLILSSFLSSLSGIFLEFNAASLVSIPSVLILIPAFIGLTGNIGNIYTSRLTTRLHLGSLTMRVDRVFRNEVIKIYALALIFYPIIGFFSVSLALLFDLGSLSLFSSMFFATVSGLLVLTIVILMSFASAAISYRFSLDPDNIMIPITTGLADVLGMIALLSVLFFFGVF